MAIIFAATRKDAEDEAIRLTVDGWTTGLYHAGLSAKERERVSGLFMAGELEIMVATNAFGMGIDRSVSSARVYQCVQHVCISQCVQHVCVSVCAEFRIVGALFACIC
jgi:superfamily II DNA helicase RecQ